MSDYFFWGNILPATVKKGERVGKGAAFLGRRVPGPRRKIPLACPFEFWVNIYRGLPVEVLGKEEPGHNVFLGTACQDWVANILPLYALEFIS